MINVIGASSLEQALQYLDFDDQNTLQKCITTAPSFSLNHYAQSDTLNLCFLLDNGNLETANRLPFWHDILNNSLTPHKSNDNIALTSKILETRLLKDKSCMTTLVYWSTPCIDIGDIKSS